MKKFFLILSLLVPLRLFAGVWSPETLPMVHLADSTRYVCNPDEILLGNTVHILDSLCGDMEREKGIQTVIVCVEHLEGDDPYEFNRQLFEKYGIGQKGADNGLVITLATLDRSYFISPGSGLEGTLPDAILKRIENAIMVPLLKQEEWDAALYATTQATFEYIKGDETLIKQAEEEEEKGDLIAGLLIFTIVGGIVGAASGATYFERHKACPKCGAKHALTVVSSKSHYEGRWRYDYEVWKCKKCGYSEPRSKKTNMVRGNSAKAGGLLGGGGRSGGGFRGGSFGGGSYGGGGAGGRF